MADPIAILLAWDRDARRVGRSWRPGLPEPAMAALEAALGLWHGAPLPDLGAGHGDHKLIWAAPDTASTTSQLA